VPWRDASDPYRIWVGEVMAQQTRIDTVREYFAPFLERFPSVEALADAELDDVLKAWEGMGYYARARRLHRAARTVTEELGGRLPDTVDGLRELPGVGPYTAGAGASMAFGRARPAVDGNTRRVLSRLFDLADPDRRTLEERASGLLAAASGRPGALNQALMDLGGEVCTPRDPACSECPLESACLARARGNVERRPAARSRGPLPHHDIGVGVVWKEGRVLVARRPPEGLLGGLWEFPGGKLEEGESPEEAIRRELREEMAVEVGVGARIERVEHAYSHFRITLHAHHARLLSGSPRAREATAWAWARPDELDDYAFPAANRRVIEALRAGPGEFVEAESDVEMESGSK
jgi:A/G-specific adenine glycosylase